MEGMKSSVAIVDFIFIANRLAGGPVSGFALIVLAEASEPSGQ